MATFQTQFIGGPNCGNVVVHNAPPRLGDAMQRQTETQVHMYVFMERWGRLGWQYQGVIGKVQCQGK